MNKNCHILKTMLRLNNKDIKLLIIEDSKILNKMLLSSFKHLDYNCESAISLQESKLKLENTFDYIVLDLNLPDAHGLELVKEIRELSDAKIIVLTSSNDNDLREYLFSYGILDYLSKSDSIEYNIKEINNLIQQVEKNKISSILIVDDSSLIRTQLVDILKPRNFSLFTSENGESALKTLQNTPIDLVLLDLELPDIHGLEVLKKIKKEIDINLPVLILSGKTDPMSIRSSLKTGASDIIKKPFVPEELLLKVDMWIDNGRKSYELACSHQLLEQYRETVDIGSIVSKADSNGVITFVNEAFEKISGYSKEELLGKPHSIIRHPDMPSEVFDNMWVTIKKLKQPWKGQVKNKKKDGSSYYVDTVINPILDIDGNVMEYIAIRSDISELQKTKEYFQNQFSITSEKFEDVLSLSKLYEEAMDKSSIVIRISKEMKITYVNDLLCELTEYAREELVGMPYDFLRHPEQNQVYLENAFKTVDEIGIWKGQLKNITKHGKTVHFVSTIVPIKNRSGEIEEYMGIRLDITKIIELHNELDSTQKEVIYKMGEIGETRSKETGNHVKRVAEYSKLMALKVGLSEQESELLKLSSPMHDIGKVGIPDQILNKPGKLTLEEYTHMKKHAEVGYELLKDSSQELLKTAAIVAYEHHEKWDGTGYPRGLKEEDIHIFGRITAICDVFDALAHERPYKKSWELDRILTLFKEERGKHFDPNLVDIFLENLNEFLEIKDKFDD